MAQTYGGGFIVVTTSGSTVTTGAASARVAIPPASDTNVPRYIRVAATTESYVKIGNSSVAATANDLLIQPADSAIIQVPNGVTHIAYIQGISSGKVNIVPLESI